MIWTALASVFLGVLDGVVSILPVATPLGLPSIAPVVGIIRSLDTVLPVHEVLALGAGALAITAAVFLVRLLLTVWDAIPLKFS